MSPTLDLHLAFIYHNPHLNQTRPLPDGALVRAMDRDPLSSDDLIAEGRVEGGGGQVHLSGPPGWGELPDIYFVVDLEGRALDAEQDALVSPQAARAPIDLPEPWSSLGRFATDHSAGLINDFEGLVVGSPDAPLTFRLTFDAFLRFVWWDEARAAYAGLPAGVLVEAMDREPISEDRIIGSGLTDEEGKVHMALNPGGERQPDIYFRTTFPPEFEGPPGVPRAWSSLDARYALESPDTQGYWSDFRGSRIGRPQSPCAFDVGTRTPDRTLGNRAVALVDGVETLRALLDAIEAAQKSIHLEVMFFFDDPMGQLIARALASKAKEGVKVRVLFDKRTTSESASHTTIRKHWIKHWIRMDNPTREAWLAEVEGHQVEQEARGDSSAVVAIMEAAGIEVADASFPYLQIRPEADEGLPGFYRDLEGALPFFTAARIDHRKLMITDGQRALLGGMNIGQEYLYTQAINPALDAAEDARTSPDEPWIKWQDCFIDIQGPAVRSLQHLFRERWITEGGDPFDLGPRAEGRGLDPHHPTFPALSPHTDGVPIRILDTTPGARHAIHRELLALASKARHQILIASAYFSSDEMIERLAAAARRGVEVTCLFPGSRHNDSLDFFYVGRTKYRTLMDAGVAVFEAHHHMNHSKVMIADDTSVIGTANFNRSSFFNHYEVVAAVEDAAFTKRFRAARFEKDLAWARRIDPEELDGLLDIDPLARLWLKTVVNPFF